MINAVGDTCSRSMIVKALNVDVLITSSSRDAVRRRYRYAVPAEAVNISASSIHRRPRGCKFGVWAELGGWIGVGSADLDLDGVALV